MMFSPVHGASDTYTLQPRCRWGKPNSILKAAMLISSMNNTISHGTGCHRKLSTKAPNQSITSNVRGGRCKNHPGRPHLVACTSLRPDSESSFSMPESLLTGTAAAVANAASEASTPPRSQPPVTGSLGVGQATDDDSEAARRGLASMAQLARAWAEVSSRLTPGTLASSEGERMYYSSQHADKAAGAYDGASRTPHERTSATEVGYGEVGGDLRLPTEDVSSLGGSRSTLLPPQQQQQQQQFQYGRLPSAVQHTSQEEQQQQQQQHHTSGPKQQQQQQQRPHFEAIITALKLALASLQHVPPRRDGRMPATRAVQLASTLADLCAAGLPLDATAMCAGVVAEAADLGVLRADVIAMQLGPDVAALVHDMLRVRQAPRRIELLDDEGASAVREWCLAFHDVRACVVEVVSWWDELQHMGGLPEFEQQALSLEALQIGAPLGHALGLGALSAVMEDMCLKVLFPESYASTCAWLRGLLDPAEDALFVAQQRLLAALDADPDFCRLAGGLLVKARTKSLFSVMKKLLHLGDMSRGGRSREELYDLLGMRAVVKPPDFLPPGEAEAAATKACYIVQEVACKLWRPIPSRSKDYIVAPKANGYQSLHLTVQLGQLDMSYDTYGTSTSATTSVSSDEASTKHLSSSPAPCSSSVSAPPSSPTADYALPLSSSSTSSCDWDQFIPDGRRVDSIGSQEKAAAAASASTRSLDPWGSEGLSAAMPTRPATLEPAVVTAACGPLCLELQIRTTAMDLAAERGDAAHAVYKGGLDAGTARQLQAWTQELQKRLAEQPRGRLLLRAAAATSSTTRAEAEATAERRRRRQQRRAAATAAAAALAAATPLSPPAAAAARRVIDVATAPVPHEEASNTTPLHPTSGGDLGMQTIKDHVEAPQALQPTGTTTAVAAAGRGSKPRMAADAKLLPPPTRRAAAIAAAGSASKVIKQATRSVVPAPKLSDKSATAAFVNNNILSGLDSPQGADGAGASASHGSFLKHDDEESGCQRSGGSGPPLSLNSAASASSDTAAKVLAGSSPTGGTPCKLVLQSAAPNGPAVPSVHDPQQHDQPQTRSQQQQQQQQRLMLFSSLGSIDEMEDTPLVMGLGQQDAAEAAEQLFRHLDVNGDGRLSLGEVRQALMDLAAPSSERDAAALLAALDSNGDGGVSIEEFVEGLGQPQPRTR